MELSPFVKAPTNPSYINSKSYSGNNDVSNRVDISDGMDIDNRVSIDNGMDIGNRIDGEVFWADELPPTNSN